MNDKEKWRLFEKNNIIDCINGAFKLTSKFKEKMVEHGAQSKKLSFNDIILHSIDDIASSPTPKELEIISKFVYNVYRIQAPYVIEAMKREGRI